MGLSRLLSGKDFPLPRHKTQKTHPWVKNLKRSPGEGNGNTLDYSCLDNPMDREAWKATVHAFTKSQAQLSDRAHTKAITYRIGKQGLTAQHREICSKS